MVTKEMTATAPGGTWKLGPRCRSILRAEDTVNVPCCTMAVKQMMPDAHTGIILSRHLISSIL